MRGIVTADQISADSVIKFNQIVTTEGRDMLLKSEASNNNMMDQQSNNMIPQEEFENLKTLTFQIEKEAQETIEKKDGHIRSLMDEIKFL